MKAQQYQILKAKATKALGTSLLIIPELRVLVLTKRHVGSGNEIGRRRGCLRWFPSFALRIPTAHDFCVISTRVQSIRDFPQTKLVSEINVRFLLNEHGDPHFLFYKFNENNILNNWEKNW